MINLGDKIKIVECTNCGSHCLPSPFTFKIIGVLEFPSIQDNKQIYHLYNVNTGQKRFSCMVQVRKVYD